MNKTTSSQSKPMNFVERIFARLEYLMSKKTMASRERFAHHASPKDKPPV